MKETSGGKKPTHNSTNFKHIDRYKKTKQLNILLQCNSSEKTSGSSLILFVSRRFYASLSLFHSSLAVYVV